MMSHVDPTFRTCCYCCVYEKALSPDQALPYYPSKGTLYHITWPSLFRRRRSHRRYHNMPASYYRKYNYNYTSPNETNYITPKQQQQEQQRQQRQQTQQQRQDYVTRSPVSYHDPLQTPSQTPSQQRNKQHNNKLNFSTASNFIHMSQSHVSNDSNNNTNTHPILPTQTQTQINSDNKSHSSSKILNAENISTENDFSHKNNSNNNNNNTNGNNNDLNQSFSHSSNHSTSIADLNNIETNISGSNNTKHDIKNSPTHSVTPINEAFDEIDINEMNVEDMDDIDSSLMNPLQNSSQYQQSTNYTMQQSPNTRGASQNVLENANNSLPAPNATTVGNSDAYVSSSLPFENENANDSYKQKLLESKQNQNNSYKRRRHNNNNKSNKHKKEKQSHKKRKKKRQPQIHPNLMHYHSKYRHYHSSNQHNILTDDKSSALGYTIATEAYLNYYNDVERGTGARAVVISGGGGAGPAAGTIGASGSGGGGGSSSSGAGGLRYYNHKERGRIGAQNTANFNGLGGIYGTYNHSANLDFDFVQSSDDGTGFGMNGKDKNSMNKGAAVCWCCFGCCCVNLPSNLLICGVIVWFVEFYLYSMHFPYLSDIAVNKYGIRNNYEILFVFIIYQISILLFVPLMQRSRFIVDNLKNCTILGLLMNGACCILFGCLPLLLTNVCEFEEGSKSFEYYFVSIAMFLRFASGFASVLSEISVTHIIIQVCFVCFFLFFFVCLWCVFEVQFF